MFLTRNDIISELSYAYLHAVASRAGFGCTSGSRAEDNAGIDAVLRIREKLAPDSIYTDFPIDIQLKATAQVPTYQNNRYSHSLSKKLYNKLRVTTRSHPIFLVVLFLPDNETHWLTHTQEHLLTRKCAYWQSIRGAPEIDENAESKTVYLPDDQAFAVDALRALATRASRREEIQYAL